MTAPGQDASVRCLVGDVQAATGSCTTRLGFTPNISAAPAFADLARRPLRLLLSGPGQLLRAGHPRRHVGRNRIHLVAGDLTPRSPGSAIQAWPSAAAPWSLAMADARSCSPARRRPDRTVPAGPPAGQP
jgi:hypothetical protein